MGLDYLEIALQVGATLEKLGATWHLGGSLASSIHGFPRATLDADLVANLQPGQGEAFCRLLGAGFYADKNAIDEAIQARSSFNVIHLKTMFKVDVFVLKDTAFHRESFFRSQAETLGESGSQVRVATPEDTVLHKLLWYEKGDEVSHRQWTDLMGVLKVQGHKLDLDYLHRWARDLGLVDSLHRALKEAGVAP